MGLVRLGPVCGAGKTGARVWGWWDWGPCVGLAGLGPVCGAGKTGAVCGAGKTGARVWGW